MFAIDADWGNGKTTFLRMLQRLLEKAAVPVVGFNAWASDYVSEPFTAIATELTDSLNRRADESDTKAKGKIKEVLKRAQDVMKARRTAILRPLVVELPIVGKALGAFVDGFADQLVEDRVSDYRDARKSVEVFKNELQEMAGVVSAEREQPLLVVMIDELDRCRPSYAVETARGREASVLRGRRRIRGRGEPGATSPLDPGPLWVRVRRSRLSGSVLRRGFPTPGPRPVALHYGDDPGQSGFEPIWTERPIATVPQSSPHSSRFSSSFSEPG